MRRGKGEERESGCTFTFSAASPGGLRSAARLGEVAIDNLSADRALMAGGGLGRNDSVEGGKRRTRYVVRRWWLRGFRL